MASDGLPLSVHRVGDERDAERRCSTISLGRRGPRPPPAPTFGRRRSTPAAPVLDGRGGGDGRAARGGRADVLLRQRWQLERRGVVGGALRSPPDGPSGRRLAASSTTRAVLTALGNDVGFDLVFSRQLIAHARAGDIAVGLSTSGNSRNLLHGVRDGCRSRARDDRHRRLRRRRDGAIGATCSTASSSTTTACTASRRRRPRSGSSCGARCRRA